MCMFIYKYACAYICVCVFASVCMCTYMCLWVKKEQEGILNGSACMHAYMYVYVFTYVCVFTWVCTWVRRIMRQKADKK